MPPFPERDTGGPARIAAGARRAAFLAATLAGLALPEKRLPGRYLYDDYGAGLFSLIRELPEYYLGRAETAILRRHAGDVAALVGPGATVVEFGAGSDGKLALLLGALDRPRGYVPVDLSRRSLIASASAVAQGFPELAVMPLCADFTRPFALPPGTAPRLGFFPGSTIGNFGPVRAVQFLRAAAADLGSDGTLVVGVDLRKTPGIIRRAYADAAGLTAAFIRNLLARINRELGADFDLACFGYLPDYDPEIGHLRMSLVSRRRQTATLAAQRFTFAKGERVHVSDAYKHTPEGFAALARAGGWRVAASWTDAEPAFAVFCLNPVH